MAIKLFDSKGEEVTHIDLQKKGPWCDLGASFEQTFVSKYGGKLNIIINPAKQNDIYAPDLLDNNTGQLADLKTQNTPFFMAGSKYSIDPQFAVTFNLKDYQRYVEKYPNIEVFFWVSWLVTRLEGYKTISVNEMEGIWFIPLKNISELVKSSPIHSYQQRLHDKSGNAKSSYVFDLGNPFFTRIA